MLPKLGGVLRPGLVQDKVLVTKVCEARRGSDRGAHDVSSSCSSDEGRQADGTDTHTPVVASRSKTFLTVTSIGGPGCVFNNPTSNRYILEFVRGFEGKQTWSTRLGVSG